MRIPVILGRRTWIKHPIDPFNSQCHDLIWADIDGDGQCELVTGKRYRAHCGRDLAINKRFGELIQRKTD